MQKDERQQQGTDKETGHTAEQKKRNRHKKKRNRPQIECRAQALGWTVVAAEGGVGTMTYILWVKRKRGGPAKPPPRHQPSLLRVFARLPPAHVPRCGSCKFDLKLLEVCKQQLAPLNRAADWVLAGGRRKGSEGRAASCDAGAANLI